MKKRIIASMLFTLSLAAISSCSSNQNNNNVENSLDVIFIKDEGVKSVISSSEANLVVGNAYEFRIELNDKFELVSVEANGKILKAMGKNHYIFILKEGKNEVKITTKGAEIYTVTQLKNDPKNSIETLYKNWGYPHFPTTGNQKLLVIPVTIKGYEENATEENRKNIEKSFFATSNEIDYESVSSFYKKSSYNKLNIEGTVTPWFNLNLSPEEIIRNQDEKHIDFGTYDVLNRAIDWVKTTQKSINLTDYDNNKDGFIDGVYLVYSAPTFLTSNLNPDLFWNFTYYNKVNKGKGDISNPLAMTYSWSSFDTMNFGYNKTITDAHIFIHEFGHQLGLKDYYFVPKSFGESKYASPMGGLDMMDYNIGDHSPYSKYALGWIAPKCVQGSTGKVTLELSPFYKTGDFAILTHENFNGLPFDEYFVLEYVKIDQDENNLNYYDSTHGYPVNAINGRPNKRFYQADGIRVTHIDSRAIDGNVKLTDKLNEMIKVKYDNTGDNQKAGWYDTITGQPYLLTTLISAKASQNVLGTYFTASDEDLFKAGSEFNFVKGKENTRVAMLPTENNKFDNGASIYFNVKIESINQDKATITIS